MSDTHHSHPSELPDSPGALLRAAADGELTAADQRRLDELLASSPDLATAIDFERDLRSATARAMGAVAAPPALADRVRAAIADDRLAENLDDAAAQTSTRSFWSRRTLLSSLAAALVLALSAALLVQGSRVSSVPLDTAQLEYRQQLAGFLKTQHDRTCADLIKAQEGKLKFTDPSSYEQQITERLGRAVRIPVCDRDRAVYFAGGGPCGVPGQGPSGHFVYHADFGPDISVFVKQDNGELPLEPGRTYALKTRECGMPGARILTRVEDGVLYFFVFDEGPGCSKALEALGVGSPTANF